MNNDPSIRIATTNDLQSITAIYNAAVDSKFETADTDHLNWKDQNDWLNNHNAETHPVFVYQTDGVVAGWISLSPYRKGRQALRFTVEISYYIHPDYKRRGIGTKLMEHAIAESKLLNYKTLIAIVLDQNVISIGLLKKFGFIQWALLPNVADFDGIACGHVYYGLRIS